MYNVICTYSIDRNRHTRVETQHSAIIQSELSHHETQPKCRDILFSLHPTAPLFLLSFFDFNSARLPQRGVSLSLVLYFIVVSLSLLCSHCFSHFQRIFFHQKDTELNLIRVCVFLCLKTTLPWCSLSNQCPMRGEKGQLPCLALF